MKLTIIGVGPGREEFLTQRAAELIRTSKVVFAPDRIFDSLSFLNPGIEAVSYTHLELLFPGCEVRPVRGNVITRLEKLDRGEYDALVLAGAGLIRLGLEGRISRFFEPEEILPAACQGILGVQAHESLDTWFLKEFHDEQARKIAMAERAFVRELNGGCSSPAAAYGKIEQDRLLLTGFDAQSGRQWMKRETISGPMDDEESLGIALARKIKEAEGSGCVAR